MNSDFIYRICPNFEDYLIDKCEVNFWRKFDSSQLRLSYDRNHQFFVRIPGLAQQVVVNDKIDGPMLNVSLSFNPIELLRTELNRKYPAELFDSEGSTSGENYLSLKLMKVLDSDGVTIKELRGVALRQLLKKINNVRSKVRDQFLVEYGALMQEYDPRMALKYVEICYDIVTPVGIELARIPEVQRGFAPTAVESSFTRYGNDKGDTTLPDAKATSVEPVTEENGRFVLKLRYSDESTAKLYCKEFTKDGVVNRFERRMRTEVMDRYINREFTDNAHFPPKKRQPGKKISLPRKIRTLARVVYGGLVDGLPKQGKFSEADKMAFVEQLCETHFKTRPKKAFVALTSGACCIVTGRTKPTNPCLNRYTLMAAKTGFLIRKSVRRKTGAYIINWTWVEEQMAAQAGVIAELKGSATPASRRPAVQLCNVSGIKLSG